MAADPLLQWVVPSVLSASASTCVDSFGKGLLNHFNGDISAYTDRLVILLSLTTLPPLLRAPGGIRSAITVLPWWWALLFGWGRLQWTAWQAMAIQYAPNPGFAKMAVNLNTVWATIAGVLVFGGRLRNYHVAGIVLSLTGSFLCTSGNQANATPKDGGVLPLQRSPHSLAMWLAPALLSSALITTVEMSARALTTRYKADASLFAQTQMAASGLVALLKLLYKRLRQPRWQEDASQASYGTGADPADTAGTVPLYMIAGVAVVRNFSQTWMALCIQRGPNPGLPKTVSGGVNTVLATMVGVLCFGSRLSASNACGIVLSIVGTYLCVR